MSKAILFLFTIFIAAAQIRAKDIPAAAVDKPASVETATPKSDSAQKIANPAGPGKTAQPPSQTPSGTKPAEPANPGQTSAKPAEPGNLGKPDNVSNPSDPGKTGNPPEQTPSGTNPADPANPGENPAKPAEPGDKEKSNTDKNVKDKSKPDNADKDQKDKDSKDMKDKKDKTDKNSNNNKDKPGKGGKSGGGNGGASLPSGIPTPPSAGASLLPAAGAIGGGILGGIFSGGEKEAAKEEKKEKVTKPAPKAAAISSETVKAATPVQTSTQAVAVEPLYSEGKGPKIAVMNFEGEYGTQFEELLAEALKADLKVYNRKELAAKKYETKTVTRVSAKKLAAEVVVEYIVTGKINKKTETLSIISVFLRDGKTGDIKMTDNSSLRSPEDLKTAAENTALKIKGVIK